MADQTASEIEDRAAALPPCQDDEIYENRLWLRKIAQARRQQLSQREIPMAATVDEAASGMRWRELEKAEDRPDENDENRVRLCNFIQMRRQQLEERRRRWSINYGNAIVDGHVTTATHYEAVDRQPIPLERGLPLGSKEEDLLYVATPIIVCTNCSSKSDHWSANCRRKFKPPGRKIEWPNASYYAPPNMRTIVERPPGSEVRPRYEENSVRVSNLYAWARKTDLIYMLGSFGRVSCVYVAIDQKNDMSKGYGFVTFLEKEAVERAIAEVNGQWYDNHMIRVEPWNKVGN